jgi:hypothetical protein
MIKYGIILLLIIIIFLLKPSEHFTYFNFNYDINTPKSYNDSDNFLRISLPSNKNTTSIYQNRFSFIPVTINDNKLTLIRQGKLNLKEGCLKRKGVMGETLVSPIETLILP